MNVYEKINEEDLTPDLKMLADVCGMETTRTILKNFAGLTFYIPKITRLDGFVHKYMKMNKEHTLKEIARELNVTEQYLKILAKRKREEK